MRGKRNGGGRIFSWYFQTRSDDKRAIKRAEDESGRGRLKKETNEKLSSTFARGRSLEFIFSPPLSPYYLDGYL